MVESIYVRGEGGSIVLMDLPLPESIQQRFDAGLIVRVNEDGSLWSDEPAKPVKPAHVETEAEAKARVDAEDDRRPLGPQRPSQAAAKAQWVDFAELSSDLSHDEAAAMTKAELVERFGG